MSGMMSRALNALSSEACRPAQGVVMVVVVRPRKVRWFVRGETITTPWLWLFAEQLDRSRTR